MLHPLPLPSAAGPALEPSRRLRLLHFSNATARGGAEEHMLTLLRGLDRKRFELHLACPPPPPPPPPPPRPPPARSAPRCAPLSLRAPRSLEPRPRRRLAPVPPPPSRRSAPRPHLLRQPRRHPLGPLGRHPCRDRNPACARALAPRLAQCRLDGPRRRPRRHRLHRRLRSQCRLPAR